MHGLATVWEKMEKQYQNKKNSLCPRFMCGDKPPGRNILLFFFFFFASCVIESACRKTRVENKTRFIFLQINSRAMRVITAAAWE